jgi:hypothetical protein
VNAGAWFVFGLVMVIFVVLVGAFKAVVDEQVDDDRDN